jgi:S1-C subfamily serine protease
MGGTSARRERGLQSVRVPDDNAAVEWRSTLTTRVARAATGALTLLALAAPALVAVGAHASDLDIRHRLHAASTTVGSGCSGVLLESPDLVATAFHCVKDGPTLEVRFTDGLVRTGVVAATDEAADQAVLLLEEPAEAEPLVLAREIPIPGSILYFEGNPESPRFQEVRLDHTGRCPSLHRIPNALFTTIDGAPGDSGAPVVDVADRVVGLVHGGAQCKIATPVDTLARLVDHVLDADEGPAPAPSASGKEP